MYAKNTPTRSVPSSSPRAMTLCGIELVFVVPRRREARRDWKEGEAGAYANLGKKDVRAQPTGSFYRVTPNRTGNESLPIMGQEKKGRQANHGTGIERGSRPTAQPPVRVPPILGAGLWVYGLWELTRRGT